MMKKPIEKFLKKNLAQQELRQKTRQIKQVKKPTFAQLEELISLAKKADNKPALKHWKKAHQTKEQNWYKSLKKGQQKLQERRNPPTIVKSAPLYSQLRHQIRQEEKFLFLREKHPDQKITWDQAQNRKVSFVESQEINKRVNLSLKEISRERLARTTELKKKTSWSLRKQRAQIRKFRGKINEEDYQKKLQQKDKFFDKLSNYHGKLAQEQYWNKKYQANPISLAEAQLAKLRIQPDYQTTNELAADKLAFQLRNEIPREVFDQPWLSYKEKKTGNFGNIFGTPKLRKTSTVRQPLIEDKLKEYQYKINFYQLFGRLPHEKEIRQFAGIDWEQEKSNYELLWRIKQRGYEKLNIPLLPWGDSRWAMTQKQILKEGSLNSWWQQAGEEELALTVTRMHKLDPQTKFWAVGAKRWHDPEFQQSLLPQGHPDFKPYRYKYSENHQLDEINRQHLTQEIWEKGKNIATQKWVDYLQKTQNQLKQKNKNFYFPIHLNGIFSSFILAKCDTECQCNVVGGIDQYDIDSSPPFCATCFIFNTTTKFIFAEQGSHPPLAPGQCPFINSSHFGREQYGKPNRWVQCGNTMPEHGATWHHNFDAYQKGTRGYGCHMVYSQTMSKKQKSRFIIVDMEW